MTPDEARAIIERFGYRGVITRRQQDVIMLIAEGKTMTEAAAALGLAYGTVASHVDRARLNIRVHEMRQDRKR